MVVGIFKSTFFSKSELNFTKGSVENFTFQKLFFLFQLLVQCVLFVPILIFFFFKVSLKENSFYTAGLSFMKTLCKLLGFLDWKILSEFLGFWYWKQFWTHFSKLAFRFWKFSEWNFRNFLCRECKCFFKILRLRFSDSKIIFSCLSGRRLLDLILILASWAFGLELLIL